MKPTFTMKPVKSSQIESVGHCASTNTLCVKFNNGGTYHYYGVDAAQFDALHKAESAGSHLGKHIKGKFIFSKDS